MRILHTSDWHLGRMFHGVQLVEDQAYVLDQFVKLLGEVKPDVVIVAGDIYDRAVPPVEAIKLLDETFSRILLDYKVPIIAIAGNHDSPDRLGFGHRLLANQGLHLTGRVSNKLKPILIDDQYGSVAFCPIPYAEASIVREQFTNSQAANHHEALGVLVTHLQRQLKANSRIIGIAHAFVAGSEESESERPLSVGGAATVDPAIFEQFHYVALGHLHRAQQAGASHIRYAGSLMKYSFQEATHQKAVTLIELDVQGKAKVEAISISPQRDVRCLEGYLTDILKGPKNGENKHDYISVNILDTGAIIDAIGKIRQVYPNVLHIDRSKLKNGNSVIKPRADYKEAKELDLFNSFYEQVTDTALTSEYQDTFSEKLDEFYRHEREVG
ncbi:MAG: exonuclease SbcCD subunit D [Bacillota bacterium]|nr:exonuclease SbcCD subunit D [Bacillota bacterium]